MDSPYHENLPLQSASRNRQTAKQHRREFWWQILIPILLFLVILGLGLSVVLSEDAALIGTISQVGTMFLLLPVILGGFLILLLVISMIYLVVIMLQWIPPKSYSLQKQIQRLNFRVKEMGGLVEKPFKLLDKLSENASQFMHRFQ